MSIDVASKQEAEKPIDRFLPLLKKHRKYQNGYTAHCPAHGDSNRSLMVWEDQTDDHVGLKCFAGCTRAAIVEAVGITEQDLYVMDGTKRPRPLHPVIGSFDLAIDKHIHPHHLDNLGVKDGKQGVIIPYYTENGTPYERYRIRTSLVAKDGSRWNTDSEAPLIPYGLQRLDQARAAGYVVIVEGESDCWTLWLYGMPALGIPGAMNGQTLDVGYLKDINRVYIVQEDDQGGKTFATQVEKHLKKSGYTGKLYKIDMREMKANDPNDLHKRDPTAFKATFEAAINRAMPLFVVGKKPDIRRMCDLQTEQLPDIRWAIPDILPEGLTLLCGKPKLGKSWLVLALQAGIASGGFVLGNVPVERGEVLYISLEDNNKRLQSRTNTILGNKKASPDFYCATAWPRLNEGGIEALEEWIQEHPQVRLIGIDTWGKIKPKTKGAPGQQYEEDYDAIAPLHDLAGKYHVSILVVHHMRKQESEDPLDMILGSTANAGAVDNMLLLYRKRGETDARLYITGRDIEDEQEIVLTFSPECATWKIKGDADDSTVATTPERQRILDVLKMGPLTVKDLAKRLGKNVNTTRNHLALLRNESKVTLENNVYRLVTTSKASNTSKASQTSNPPKTDNEVTSPDQEVTSPTSQTSNPLVTPLPPLTEPSHDDKKQPLTSVTSHTTQKKRDPIPSWYVPGTPDWKKQVARNGEVEMMRRRQAWLDEQAGGTPA